MSELDSLNSFYSQQEDKDAHIAAEAYCWILISELIWGEFTAAFQY